MVLDLLEYNTCDDCNSRNFPTDKYRLLSTGEGVTLCIYCAYNYSLDGKLIDESTGQ